ncbi:MAG: Stk1 family PASTA domain-containing Ser/Thr kinase [Lachnospiraceae bacterium]|nr:Stk1 family PASTA domain-containing Ser/Thr kinase [Lachnospiraceae bacterium]MDD3661034.1 Stk1 family PASTA domain-containing Ser/Thr kinase [Lachnospiraceae bacterium]
MIKTGMLIGDRYEILEKIGTGGMSDVYKAKCHKLNRFVAVKILKQEFSENTNFVHKFRIEAQAAAGLMHPNIVNVYDVGEENNIYYIVMELVEGITLKKYIEKKARLSVKEAISIAIQVSMGIEAAHNNRIIHRDIKPQNIIISREGKVKVTDFGIAKAATSNTITSNVMGSVHYTSPEQARGGYSDEKSDIYSLGITLFEMLTGRVPFNGETTVAIAIKHIQEEMPSPRDYVPEIPVSVEQIVFKCTQKSPDRRYHNMAELISDLKKSLIHPDENFVKIVNLAAQEETRMVPDQDVIAIKQRSEKPAPKSEGMRLKEQQVTQAPKKTSSVSTKKKQRPVVVEEADEEEYDPRMERITTALTIIVAVVIGCILLFFAGRAVGLFPTQEAQESEVVQKESQTMPEVIGKSLDEARTALEAAGITYTTEYDISTEYDKNTVMDSSVAAGETVTTEMSVIITVSAGENGVKVPDVTGLSEAEATAALEKEGFAVKKATSVSDETAKGDVISQEPEAGAIADRNDYVTLTISTGGSNEKVEMPDVLGMTETQAKAVLVAAGFVCTTVTEVEDIEYEAGTVCYQSYTGGSMQTLGTDVELRLSLGASYSCNISVEAPTDYESGNASVVLTAADTGKVLFSTTTTSFPVAINISGIETSDTGILTISYHVPMNPPQTDEDGNVVSSKVTAMEKTIQFIKE